ncbi:endoglucanase 25-like [Papaver somniferum]|uniref:endoglucanase 25-like n=1 Tax=Papaver somniferum TaxID=3469 RepID=UPI000E6FC0AD|nr:endoglucanase 25-like [Papaver somniferum]
MLENLQAFSASQVDYILGVNPKKLSYVVGYGSRFPTHVHHRGASIPNDGASYGCTEGFKWRDTSSPNPHNITGAMVGGPDNLDRYRDIRARKDSAEPTLMGNAGLVAALAALSVNGDLVWMWMLFSLNSNH